MSDEMIDAGMKLAQPFNSVALSAATNVGSIGANNIILRWKLKGWIKKVSYGRYERTKDFGGGIAVGTDGEKMLADIHKEIEATKPANIYE